MKNINIDKKVIYKKEKSKKDIKKVIFILLFIKYNINLFEKYYILICSARKIFLNLYYL